MVGGYGCVGSGKVSPRAQLVGGQLLSSVSLSPFNFSCTAALVGGITHSISQPNMKQVHSDHAQPIKVATNIHRIIYII